MGKQLFAVSRYVGKALSVSADLTSDFDHGEFNIIIT